MRLTALLLLLLPFAVRAQTTIAGSTPGTFRVTESGAAEYRIPIRVPPGIAGLEPKLALVYHSQSGNGLLGVGWSLEGLSSITRCPRTKAQDGVPGGVNYALSDRYCLDGQRLVAITGNYGENETEYRTERESFTRVVSYGAAGNGPRWFKAWTRSGQILEYGYTEDSRIQAQGKPTVRVWALNRVSDTNGNSLAVTYAEDGENGVYRPHEVIYAGASVRFDYEARPDVVSLYQAGSLIRSTQRLKSVRTFVGATLAQEYRLTYQASASTQRSRLASARLCDAAGTCLAPLSFSWADRPTGFGPAIQSWLGGGAFGESTGWNNANPLRRLMTDVNGDGLPDIVGISPSNVFVSLNNGTSFDGPQLWLCCGAFGSATGWTDENVYPRFLTDVNGDGLPDIVGIYAHAVYVALNRGSHFGPEIQTWLGGGAFGSTTGWVDDNRYPRFLADVDGDGLPDIVGLYSHNVFVALNNGSSFGNAQVWLCCGAFGSDTGWNNSNPLRRFLTDVNGDGLPDIVGIYSHSVSVALNNGASFSNAQVWLCCGAFGSDTGWVDENRYPRFLADVNGDGLPDIVGIYTDQVFVALNDGTKFGPAIQSWLGGGQLAESTGWNNSNPLRRLLTDVNGDGLPDIVGIYSHNVFAALNNGSSFGNAQVWLCCGAFGSDTGWVDENRYPHFLADLNGDGLPDISGIYSVATYAAMNAGGGLPDLLLSASDGLRSTTIGYAPVTSASVYVREPGSTHPVRDVAEPLYVVSQVQAGDGIGGLRQTSYRYFGGKNHVQSGAFLGFRKVELTDAVTGVRNATTFRQDYPYQGLPALSERLQLGGAALSRVTNRWADTLLAPASGSGGRYHRSEIDQIREESYALDGAALPIVTTTTQYDDFGNPTSITVSTPDGYRKMTTNTYSNDDVSWFLGRLMRSTVQSTSP